MARAGCRFIKIPLRPAGTEDWTEDQLQALVTRDAVIGALRNRPCMCTAACMFRVHCMAWTVGVADGTYDRLNMLMCEVGVKVFSVAPVEPLAPEGDVAQACATPRRWRSSRKRAASSPPRLRGERHSSQLE